MQQHGECARAIGEAKAALCRAGLDRHYFVGCVWLFGSLYVALSLEPRPTRTLPEAIVFYVSAFCLVLSLTFTGELRSDATKRLCSKWGLGGRAAVKEA